MADIDGYREKSRTRWRRYRERQVEAAEVRISVMLPAALVAKLDAAKGAVGRSAVVQQALEEWLRSPPPPAPRAPAAPPAPNQNRGGSVPPARWARHGRG